jgi:hypothetical protein
MADFSVYQGDDLEMEIPVAKEGVPDTTSGASLKFYVVPNAGVGEADAVVTKTTPAESGVTPIPPKLFRWRLTASELAALTVKRRYKWFVRYTDSGGIDTTLDEGSLTVIEGVKVA